MSDILFKCPKCASHLSMEASGVGQTLPCNKCRHPVRVPPPAISFRCGQCKANLCAPCELAGEYFACPGCATRVFVPPRTTRSVAACPPSAVTPVASDPSDNDTSFTTPSAQSDAATPPERQCPSCKTVVHPTSVICVNCGTDLRTGKKYGYRGGENPLLWGLATLVIALAVGGWYYWERQQNQKQQTAEQQLKAVNEQHQKDLDAEKMQQASTEAAQKKAAAEAAQAESNRLQAAHVKDELTQRTLRIAQLSDRIFNTSDVNLFDALVRCAVNHKLRISIDPGMASLLRGISVKTADANAIIDRSSMEQFLQRYDVIVRPCPISEKDTNLVCFVTTAPVWEYSCACRLIRNGQLALARQRLNKMAGDVTGFGKHCLELRKVLDVLITRQSDLNQLSEQVPISLADCECSYKNAQAFHKEAQKTLDIQSRGGRAIGKSAEELETTVTREYRKALADIDAVCSSLQRIKQAADTDNKLLYARYTDACNAHLLIWTRFSLLLASEYETLWA